MLRPARVLLLLSISTMIMGFGFACGIPEQTLRDEQQRTRRYRDAYENEHDENQLLRAKTEQLQAQLQEQTKTPKGCAASSAESAPRDPPVP
jgi:hypothetical protein